MSPDKMTLVFVVPRKEVLSANKPEQTFVKAKKAKALKDRAFKEGFEQLPEDLKESINARKLIIDSEENNKIVKSRLTKKIKAANPDLAPKAIKDMVEAEFEKQGFVLEAKSTDIGFAPVFNHFKITVLVSGPTARRLDPPNYSPTTKHLIDGLTWCGYWEDDDWHHLDEVSFKYGGANDTKDCFVFTFVIEELEELLEDAENGR